VSELEGERCIAGTRHACIFNPVDFYLFPCCCYMFYYFYGFLSSWRFCMLFVGKQ